MLTSRPGMNRTLQAAVIAAGGLLLPVTLEGVAAADVGAAQVTKLLSPSENDLAPTSGDPARLRRTDEEQPGAEMGHLAFFGDQKSGLYFEMRSGELNGTLPPERIQLALVPFHLAQGPGGEVIAVGDPGARFVTNNDGNEYRNANHPIAYAVNGGNVICAEYNYQPNNSNDTKRYAQCFNKAGDTIMPQTLIYAQNNDDCSMNQDAQSTTLAQTIGTMNYLVAWRGCNGNGSDDGWLQSFAIECDAASTTCSFQEGFDVSLCEREERSHGLCTVGTDPNTAECSWTEGNTQPQRDGTWLAAVDITPGATGEDLQERILWKQQIDGRKGDDEETRTYSMRAMHSRIMKPNAAGNGLVPTDLILWRSGDLHGNNNSDGKGGTYYGNIMAVMEVTAAGMQYRMPLTNMQDTLIGLDGTHLGMSFGLFGTTDKLMPGMVFIGGSHTGGGYAAKVRTVGWNETTNSLADLGSYSIAPYDRHLYPNYLGNNPGNQGRNYSGSLMIANPFVGQNNNKDAYLMVMTTTGKDPADMMRPELKLSSYITVMPIAQVPADVTPTPDGDPEPEPDGDPTPEPDGDPTPDPTPDPDPNGTGAAVSGCSTGGSSTGGAASTLLLIGLAAFIRRRR